jgi:translation initiation factor 1
MSIENLKSFDPFAEEALDDEGAAAPASEIVDIRVQQRNGRKKLTTVAGLPQEIDFKRLLKAFKKSFCCNGTVVKDESLGKIIQVQGDQRRNIFTFITNEGIAKKENVKVHGP